MLTVGLTGGIASGKSTVARLLQERGCAIIEADLLAHQYLQPENPVSQEVTREFGAGILDASGKIDRTKLGEVVFGDAKKIGRLNAIIHPHVLKEIARRLHELQRTGETDIAVVVAALHIETGFYKTFDRLAVAWCRPEQQLERLLNRGFTSQQAVRRIASQMPMEEKRRLADDQIDCSGTLQETTRQVDEALARWKRVSSRSC
ncbi:MAG TPA: dephospho-CoA kinase [Candidatus Acidoferrales bacterium]|nr:dephospho-CoA kinase [Candidatus Acidoferrales bacterium]